MLWEWKIGSNKFECINIYKGHERNIESLSVSPKSELFASGGWDSFLKIWPVLENDYVISNEDGESKAKRIKKDDKSMIKVNIIMWKIYDYFLHLNELNIKLLLISDTKNDTKRPSRLHIMCQLDK